MIQSHSKSELIKLVGKRIELFFFQWDIYWSMGFYCLPVYSLSALVYQTWAAKNCLALFLFSVEPWPSSISGSPWNRSHINPCIISSWTNSKSFPLKRQNFQEPCVIFKVLCDDAASTAFTGKEKGYFTYWLQIPTDRNIFKPSVCFWSQSCHHTPMW